MTAAVLAVLVALASGCIYTEQPSTIAQELAKTEEQQTTHLKTTPPPKLDRSQERKNLIERLNRFNTDSKVRSGLGTTTPAFPPSYPF